jgi:hypothetical protein
MVAPQDHPMVAQDHPMVDTKEDANSYNECRSV